MNFRVASGVFRNQMSMLKWNRVFIECLLVVNIVMWHEEGNQSSRNRCIAMARTDPVELQAVYAMMAATGNTWAASIPDVCVKSGRWHGIECAPDREFYHVVGLSFGLVSDQATAFPACAPDSTISPAVANLTHLKKLSYFACCTDNPQPIPREIGQLSATLETLHLRSNGHVGALPPELASLAKLRTLDVHGNSLTDTMPVWLSSLTALQVVDMSDNAFQGQVDAETFVNLERLIIFDASANRLAGAIPDSINRLRALKKLDLSYNNFTDAIPATVGDLENLLALNLAHNALTGPLPTSFGGLQNLKSMDLQGNHFQGPIPASFGRLRSLEGLVLSGAQFRGPIPSSLGSLTNLRALFLDGNQLTGAIPPALGGLPRVYEMELSRNLLAGPVPFSASFVSRLGRRLRLEHNKALCFEFQATNNSLRSAQGATIQPAVQPPLFSICRGSKSNNQSVDTSNSELHPELHPPPVPSTASWMPASEPSSSGSTSLPAFHASKHTCIMVFLVTIPMW